MKIETTKRLVISTTMYIVFFIFGTILIPITCPDTFHETTSLSCDFLFFTPEISGIISGVIFGWRNKIILSVLSIIVPIIGLSIVLALGYLDLWYGSDIIWAIWFGVTHTILPAVLASVFVSIVHMSTDTHDSQYQ